MNSQKMKKVTSDAINEFAEALNSGHSAALTRYLTAMAKFRTYSFLNMLLILRQCPDASRVAGYRTWQSFGRQVRHGERGIMIFAPIFRKLAVNDTSPAPVDAPSDVVAYRAVYVWDERQTSGKELPEIGRVTGDPSVYLARLEAFVQASGLQLIYSPDIAPARGVAEGGKITLLPGLAPAETFATLVHEQAHIMLHQSKRRAETTKRIRETEAEAVAFVVSKAIGLGTGSAAQDYVALYGGDAKLLLESLEHVQQTASHILDSLELDSQLRAA